MSDATIITITEPYPRSILAYMKQNNLNIEQFAKKIDVSTFTLFNWITAYRVPLKANALKISKLTRNFIPFDDYLKTSSAKYVFICPHCCEYFSKKLKQDLKYLEREYCNSYIRSSSRINIPCWKCGEMSIIYRLPSNVEYTKISKSN